MKRIVQAIAVAFATLAMASLMAVDAGAQCGASDGPMTSNAATAVLMHSMPKPAVATTARAKT
jgi:hypothetical protein